MAQQAINTQAVVAERQADGTDQVRRLTAELVTGIRVDTLPRHDGERLAAEGKFYPLTTDQDGNLRVVTPEWISVRTDELEVLREHRDLLREIRDLLLKIA